MTRKEQALALLQPGDILLYRATGWLGGLIKWGQWTGQSREALEYCHAGVVLDPITDQGFEMNPPRSRFTKLSNEDWDSIDVWRPVPPVYADRLRGWCLQDEGTAYPFVKYAYLFIPAGILARLGAVKLARWMGGLGSGSNQHLEVCSATVCSALSAAMTGGVKLWPKPEENMRPADIPLGKVWRVL